MTVMEQRYVQTMFKENSTVCDQKRNYKLEKKMKISQVLSLVVSKNFEVLDKPRL